MRIIAFILSFVVLALTAVPCIDKLEENCLQKQEVSQEASHSHQDGLDHCSPFCTCQCCQVSFFVPAHISAVTLVTSINNFVNISKAPESFYIFEFYNPPKSLSSYTA